MSKTGEIFTIHPVDLRRRRRRCRSFVQALGEIEREFVRRCNVCEAPENVVIATRDRYGIPVRTAVCRKCGLVYLVDRFTASGYSDFYSGGKYRALSGRYNGTSSAVDEIFGQQREYAETVIRALEGYVSRDTGFDLLDVGGATGLVARRVSDHFGMVPTVLDPAPADARGAASLGMRTEIATLEEWEPDRQFGLILLCRTIEHLYDLRASLLKIRSLLRAGGLFYCDIVDFGHASAYEGPPEATSKIDHCYWLIQETAPAIFEALGFSIVSMNTVSGPCYVGFLLEPSDPVPIGEGLDQTVAEFLREIRRCEERWREFARQPFDLADRLRRAASRARSLTVRWLRISRRALPGRGEA
jgi:SAM-dependent methyltransferase